MNETLDFLNALYLLGHGAQPGRRGEVGFLLWFYVLTTVNLHTHRYRLANMRIDFIIPVH